MSYANAAEAIEGLRHKRTGAVLPQKIVARNTKLVYFADELVGLKLHDTLIAMYREDDVVLDVRQHPSAPGGHHNTGWFTNVTLDRLEAFTPARIYKDSGLTFVADPMSGGFGAGRLYAHASRITSNSSFENDLDPATERAILATVGGWSQRVRRYSRRVVTAWSNWAETPECCREVEQDPDGDMKMHVIEHVQRNEPAVPEAMPNLRYLRDQGFDGDRLRDELAAALAEEISSWLSCAVYEIDPNFPYPQATPRRR